MINYQGRLHLLQGQQPSLNTIYNEGSTEHDSAFERCGGYYQDEAKPTLPRALVDGARGKLSPSLSGTFRAEVDSAYGQ